MNDQTLLTAQLDHLVIAARSLDEGVAWCEATLGVTPGPGGTHQLMGTHNRLLSIASAAFPKAYLEIIAIDPHASPTRAAGLARWFDLDDAGLRARLANDGPRLIHFVARVNDAGAACCALADMREPIHRGPLLEASRDTSDGLLQWKITVRDDGQRLFDGALPTLIEWGNAHPADAMHGSGVTLTALRIAHPQAATLMVASDEIGLRGIEYTPGPARLTAEFQTPRGLVVITS